MGTAIHFDATHGFDTRTACGKSTHLYADAMRRSPIRVSVNGQLVTCKSCRKVLDKQR